MVKILNWVDWHSWYCISRVCTSNIRLDNLLIFMCMFVMLLFVHQTACFCFFAGGILAIYLKVVLIVCHIDNDYLSCCYWYFRCGCPCNNIFYDKVNKLLLFALIQCTYTPLFGICYCLQDLTVTDDTVLEEHNEDPALVQMRLIGDGGKFCINNNE